eukprot:scaffold2251_cov139-Skeletonema_dohrnii-CCMP3373.AAC.1
MKTTALVLTLPITTPTPSLKKTTTLTMRYEYEEEEDPDDVGHLNEARFVDQPPENGLQILCFQYTTHLRRSTKKYFVEANYIIFEGSLYRLFRGCRFDSTFTNTMESGSDVE